jgi:hypothetical protein
LGDGVYASFDGYHIWLSTGQGPGESKIALAPYVYAALVSFNHELPDLVALLRSAEPELIDEAQTTPCQQCGDFIPNEEMRLHVAKHSRGLIPQRSVGEVMDRVFNPRDEKP